MNSEPIRVHHSYTASAERVYDAWLDPAKAGKFLFTSPEGKMLRVEMDVRVGGKFLFVDLHKGVEITHVGSYLELERPRRIVFEFAVPQFSPEYSRVTIEIAPKGTGCALSLSAANVPDEWRKDTTEGWTMILGSLERELGR